MFIIAMAAVGVTAVVNPEGATAKQINRQGDTIFAQMQYALDEALFTDRPLGILIEQDEETLDMSTSYRWLRYNGTRWEATKEPLGSFELPEDFAWQIDVEEESLEDSLDELLKEDEEIQPQLIFYPSGEVSDFNLELRMSDERVQGDLDLASEIYTIAIDEGGELARYGVGEQVP